MNANHALISMAQTAFVYMSKEKKPSGALSKLTFGRLMTRLAIVNDFFGKCPSNMPVAAGVCTPREQQDIALPLVIPFGMEMFDIFAQRSPQ